MNIEVGGSPSVPGGLPPEYAVFLPQAHTEDQPPADLELRKGSIPTVDHLLSWPLSGLIKGLEFREVVRRFLRLG